MDICHLLSFFIIFRVVVIALHTYFSCYYNNDCVWHCFVHHYTIPSGLKWSTCSNGRSDPTKFLLQHFWDLQGNFFVSSRQAATGRKVAVVNTAALYFKWMWWSQNLRTWKACTNYVVGLQDLNSSSEGLQYNQTFGTEQIPLLLRSPYSVPTLYSVFLHTLNLVKKTTDQAKRENNQDLHFYSQGTGWQTCILEGPK